MEAPAERPGLPEWLLTAQKSVRDAAERVLGDNASPALLAVLAAAVHYANADERRRELVVDIQAVLSVIAGMPGDDDLPDSHLLAEWLNDERRMVMVEERIGAAAPMPPVLSASVRGQVLPRAARLAGAGPAGIWHLLMALAELDETQWPPMSPAPIDSAGLERLRAFLTERGPDTPDKAAAAAPAPAAPASLPESTPLLSDNPSADDLLGRRPLVQALAIRLMRLQAEEAASPEPAAVMVHLHGAWGSGKSSMVKLLAEELGKTHPRWLVVDFNAWRNTRVKPPWWNMLTELKRAQARRLVADVMPLRWLWLQLRWAWVSPAVDNVGLLAGFLVLAALLAGGLSTNPAALMERTISGEWARSLKELPAQFALYAGLLTAGFGALRAALLGGRRVAEGFDALRIDSYRPFIDLFALLTGITRTPVLIVLDDLDRCDAGTVTDLLEGIQTLFRGRPVVFLAVADRRWITASFTKRFGDFHKAAGDEARPVGDLFLDKMFQLSVGVPQVLPDAQQIYLDHHLGVDQTPQPRSFDFKSLPPNMSVDDTADIIAQTPPDLRRLKWAQIAVQTASLQSDRITEHRLRNWSHLMEANPRAIKRLVNSVGMARAQAAVEQRSANFDTIALWTMLELRWPRVADLIAANPVIARKFAEENPAFGHKLLDTAWKDPQFRKLAAHEMLGHTQLELLIGRPVSTQNSGPLPPA